jgi:4-hydroxymandelate oxidase
MREPRSGREPGQVRSIAFSRELSWKDVAWLRKLTTLPLVLKGVAHPDDARLALAEGVDALIVSNHGGRQLDTVPPAIRLLPAIADAVSGRVPLLIDGGIRRGTDIVKALCLGASAVAIGRPVLWGLAVGGAQGVRQVLEWFRADFDRALALCGCRALSDLSPDLVRC